MRRVLLRAAALALSIAPAFAEPGAKTTGRPPADRAAPERSGPDRPAAPPVIGCPSLANYRLLMRRGGPAAAAQLADPRADHLGCAALPRGRLTGIAERVALGGENYDCARVQGTSACHWMEAGALAVPAAASPR